MSTGRPPAGWYPDGSGPGRVRWYDGETWTARTGRLRTADPPHPAPTHAYPAPPRPAPARHPSAGPAGPPAPWLASGGPPSVAGAPADAYASWPARVGASLLDQVAALAPYLLALAYASEAAPWVDGGYGYQVQVPTPAVHLALLVGGLISLAVWILNRGVAQARTGQSLGKSAVGIRLRSTTTGTPPGTALCLLRDIGHVADSLAFLGYLRPLWDPQRRTFADELVSTVVVRDARTAGARR